MSASPNSITSPIEVKSKIKRIAGREFELTCICDGMYTLKSVKTGKVTSFNGLPALHLFIRGLTNYLRRKDRRGALEVA